MDIPPLVHFTSGAAFLPVVLAFAASRALHASWPFFGRFLGRV